MDLQAAYVRVLKANEGGDPYRLSDAYENDGPYGFSFGRKQLDLFTFTGGPGAPSAAKILAAVLQQAAALGAHVEPADIAQVQAGALSHKASAVREVHALLIARIDAVLASPQGRQALDTQEAVLIAKDVAAAVARAEHPGPAKALLTASLAAQLIYLDYLNFFGSAGDKFDPFLNGEEVDFTLAPSITLADPPHLTELLRFVFSTRQGQLTDAQHRPDTLRRMHNVLRVAAGDGAPDWALALQLTAADLTWLKGAFRTDLYTDAMRAAATLANGGPLPVFDALAL